MVRSALFSIFFVLFLSSVIQLAALVVGVGWFFIYPPQSGGTYHLLMHAHARTYEGLTRLFLFAVSGMLVDTQSPMTINLANCDFYVFVDSPAGVLLHGTSQTQAYLQYSRHHESSSFPLLSTNQTIIIRVSRSCLVLVLPFWRGCVLPHVSMRTTVSCDMMSCVVRLQKNPIDAVSVCEAVLYVFNGTIFDDLTIVTANTRRQSLSCASSPSSSFSSASLSSSTSSLLCLPYVCC